MIYASYGICNDEPINLVENVNILQKGTKICKTFKDYLVNITDELNIYNWEEDASCYSKLTSQMSVFNNHPIIRLNKYKYRNLSILNLSLYPQIKYQNISMKSIVTKVQEITYL